MKKRNTPPETIKAVYTVRESHLGYRAYSLIIVDGKATAEPLHAAPDVQAVAIAIASRYLEDNL